MKAVKVQQLQSTDKVSLSGQFKEASYVFCYVAVRLGICNEPPLNISTTLSRSSMRQWCYNTKGQQSRQRKKTVVTSELSILFE